MILAGVVDYCHSNGGLLCYYIDVYIIWRLNPRIHQHIEHRENQFQFNIMDHKRGYNFVEDHNSCVSPTDSPSRPKRLKDLSHQHEYPYHLNHSRPAQQATSCASAPKKSHHALHNLRWQSHVALDRAEMETATRPRSAPQQTELEKKMEDRAYSNLLPMVKKVQTKTH